MKSFTNPSRPTLRDLARETGLAVSTVSYALRGAPNVPPATAARVRDAARRLGYRPQPRIAELMASIRRRRPPPGDRLAFVWPSDTRADATVEAGARARAAELGYGLETFAVRAAGGPRRLAQILRGRGIAGVVFGPVTDRERVELDWPWDDFAMAVVGAAEWPVALPRAAHHHFEAMRLVLARLRDRGARRPAAWLPRLADERGHRGWRGAWLAHGPAGAAARLRLASAPPSPTEAAEWLARTRADALVVVDRPTALPFGSTVPIALLDRRPSDPFPGIGQSYARIASHAVDLVLAQLHRADRGLPADPKTLLFPGAWEEP